MGRISVVLGLTLVLTTCGGAEPAPGASPLRVVATVPPLAFLAQSVGGEHVVVTTLLVAGAHPESQELSPSGALALARADLVLGVGPERFAAERRFLEADARHGASTRRVVLLADDAATQHRQASDELGGRTSLSGSHGHDPHLWLEPEAMRRAAPRLADALSSLDPEHAALYQRRSAELQQQIDATVARLRVVLRPVSGRTLFTQHPSWGGLLEGFSIHQRAIEAESKGPSARRLAAAIDAARAAGCRVVVIEPRRSHREAEVLADAVGADVQELDPLARDWLANLEHVGRVVRDALEVQRG